MPILLPASPNLDDLDGLMGQALIDLAMAFDFKLPAKGSDSMGTPPFEFPSLLASMPRGGESTSDIFKTIFMDRLGS